MEKKLHILGISGSLRSGSYNRGLLCAASALMAEGLTLEIADLSQIPLYNEDDFSSRPEAITHLQEQIRLADGVIIATPEYNHSIPGVLKNALDWASRPMKTQPFAGKPLAVMGAGGRSGTVWAQDHLRQVAVQLGMQILMEPRVAVERSWEKFDPDGNLVDEESRQLIKDQMAAFKTFVIGLKEQEILAGNPV